MTDFADTARAIVDAGNRLERSGLTPPRRAITQCRWRTAGWPSRYRRGVSGAHKGRLDPEHELLKDHPDIDTHATQVAMPLVENSQDMVALAAQLRPLLAAQAPLLPAFYIRRHGLYVWGPTMAAAEAVAEGSEYLLACEWEATKAEGRAPTRLTRLTPDHPQRAEMRAKFLAEHVHDDDEVRFFLEGAGLFYIRSGDTVVHALECTAGDLIVLPAGTQHWFDTGERPSFTASSAFHHRHRRPPADSSFRHWSASISGQRSPRRDTRSPRAFCGRECAMSRGLRIDLSQHVRCPRPALGQRAPSRSAAVKSGRPMDA